MIRYLTWKSIKNRGFTSFLCVLSIALSITLFLGIERIRTGAREGFTNTISQTDLIVGAKGSPLQLLLYSVFHIGSPINNIRYSSFEKISSHPIVSWAIPISLGDAYKGFRVVGTNQNFYKHYRYRGDNKIELAQGKEAEGIWDVVLGANVAAKFNHKIGDDITLSHGISSKSLLKHDKSPFKIVGVLAPTQTPVDQAVYITLHGMEAMHIGWETGVPDKSKTGEKEKLKKEDIEIDQITSFLLKAKSRIHVLRFNRMIDQFPDEPLMAAIPALTLGELWKTIAYIEKVLILVSLCVLFVGLLGILISLYTSINERRREMAILRSLGTSSGKILGLLLFESGLLVLLGNLFGLLLLYGILFTIRPYLEANFSVYMPIAAPTLLEAYYLLGVLAAGVLAGLLPALKAYRNSLQDGLTIKF